MRRRTERWSPTLIRADHSTSWLMLMIRLPGVGTIGNSGSNTAGHGPRLAKYSASQPDGGHCTAPSAVVFGVLRVDEQRVVVVHHVTVPPDRVVLDRITALRRRRLEADVLPADLFDVVEGRILHAVFCCRDSRYLSNSTTFWVSS